MDTEYIIERLKTTPYKYATVEILKRRLSNVADYLRVQIVDNLKKELRKEENSDIYYLIKELLYRKPISS